MKRTFVALGVALLFAVQAQAATIRFGAQLSGPAEAPPNASPGAGFARVTLDPVAHTLRVSADFADLIGLVTASHIHCCTAVPLDGTVSVATRTPTFLNFPSGVTAGSYDAVFDTLDASTYRAQFITASGGTTAGAEAALLAGLREGRAYFNIHTNAFLGGEIRGFLVPEPSVLLLVGVSALAFAVRRRR